jgi:hypothetical protein
LTSSERYNYNELEELYKLCAQLKSLELSKTRKGERAHGYRGKANLEISLGIVVADVSY